MDVRLTPEDVLRLRGMGVYDESGVMDASCGPSILAAEVEREIRVRWGHEWEQVAAHEYRRAETYLRMAWWMAGALAAVVPLAVWGWAR